MLRLPALFRRTRAAADTAPWPAADRPATDIVATRGRRIARLAARLAADGIAWPDPLPTGDAAIAWLDALDTWTLRHWPGSFRFEDLDSTVFRRVPWPDGSVGRQFTEVTDVGFAIADVARALRPDLAWGIDNYVGHAVDGVGTAGQLVLLDPQVPLDATDPEVVDPFDTAMLRAIQVALRDREPQPLREGLRPMLWFSHRHLFD